MENIILYNLFQSKEYSLKKFVDDYGEKMKDDSQGIIFNEYDDDFLKATYWQRKKKKEYKYSLEEKRFEEIEEEIVNIAEFGIQVQERKLLIFGNKQMAQRIITLIGIISKNAYSITEYFINIEKLVDRICKSGNIDLLKMKLTDIVLDKGLLVSCNVNLKNQDNPQTIVFKYICNIVVISFKFDKINTNITVYKTGKIVLSKILDDDRDELIQKIIKIAC